MAQISTEVIKESLTLGYYGVQASLQTTYLIPAVVVLALGSGTITVSTAITILSNVSKIASAVRFVGYAAPILGHATQLMIYSTLKNDTKNIKDHTKYSDHEIMTKGSAEGFILIEEVADEKSTPLINK